MTLIDFKSHMNSTIKLAIPVSIGQLGHIMLGVVDSFMVGKLGAEPLAAAALANGLFFLVMVLGIGMSHAITALVAIAKGENKNEECGIIVRQGLIVNLIFGLILTLATYFLAKIVIYLNQEPLVAQLTESYLSILSISIVPFMLFQTYRQFVEGLSDTKTPMYIAIFANIVNAFSNWVLIFGNLGFPALGLDGAGFATLMTRTFMGLIMMLIVLKSVKYKDYDPTLNFRSINWKMMKKIIRVGFPSGLSYSFEVGAFSFASIIIGWLGSEYLAAHQIAINLASISYMVVLGISSAATIRVGNAFGERNLINIKLAGYSSIFLGFLFMSFTGIMFILLNEFLPSLYINDFKVVEIAASLLIIAALFQLSDGIQAVGLGVLKGLTDVKIPMAITLFAYWIIALPIGYILGFYFEMNIIGIWLGLLLGLTVAAFLFVLRFSHKLKFIDKMLGEVNKITSPL
ncbi:MAG: MATE family efflux transporter [Ignavibacteriales bacterium]|nr:MATE family efflux transporter [Ignavibacteriales bacterium]